MLTKKIRAKMLLMNKQESYDLDKVNIPNRIQQIVLYILRNSDSPNNDLIYLGLYFDKNRLLIDIDKFSKVVCLPKSTILADLDKHGFMKENEEPLPDQFKNWLQFTNGNSQDAQTMYQVVDNNPKFMKEQQYETDITENSTSANDTITPSDVKKISIQLPNTFTLETQFHDTGYVDNRYAFIHTSSERFVNLTNISWRKIGISPKEMQSMLIGSGSTWISIMNLQTSQDRILSSVIEPQITEE